MRLTLPLFAIALSVAPWPIPAQEKEAPPPKQYSYSARFYCSEPADRRLPGDCERCWDTEIALSNTGPAEANVEIWAVEARPISENPPPTRSEPSIELTLVPNDAVKLGCGSIDDLLPAEQSLGRARKARPNGFLRFVSNRPLQAVATYVYRVSEGVGDSKSAGASIEVVHLTPEP
jgi:hypothetical protein